MTFKCINGLAPDYLACNFHADPHSKHQVLHLNIPKYRTTSDQHSCTRLWPQIEGNLSKFKKDIKLACLAT